MNFKTFSVGTTNIFPAANSTTGSGLLTEYNLRSRESVCTPEAVKYMIGPSYVHAEDDFLCRKLTDSTGAEISTSTLEITPGRALVNGHYVENLESMVIDMTDANAKAKLAGQSPLKGHLCVGLVAMYSTEETMSGAILTETDENVWAGVQVVILPAAEFKLPTSDEFTMSDPSTVTAHIKLAEFDYTNNTIRNIKNNYPNKCVCIDSTRINNIDRVVSEEYVKKTGLQKNQLYVFAQKDDPDSGYDTWCKATDSLMVWDSNPTTQDNPGQEGSARFISAGDGVSLYIPHKQVDGTDEYYKPVELPLPVADFSNGAPGVVDKAYTDHIKDIRNKLQEYYQLATGKMRRYVERLDDIKDLPNIQGWDIGDYVLVGQDYSVGTSYDVSGRAPSTLYVVVPGMVRSIEYVTSKPNGNCLDTKEFDSEPSSTDSTTYNSYWGISPDTGSNYFGVSGEDYFLANYNQTSGESTTTTPYYYKVQSSDSFKYSSAVWVTGSVPLASEEAIGGFLNVNSGVRDQGYVGLDDNGNLRLLDYALLRTGVLAYQLGEDYSTPKGITAEELQGYLDEYVNDRVAFPSNQHVANVLSGQSNYLNMLNIQIQLSDEGESTELILRNIDSRFGTAVQLNVSGETSGCTINIIDCEKIRVNSNLPANVIVNVQKSCLYYDAALFDQLGDTTNISLWYEKFVDDTDPDIEVDGMTVTDIGQEIQPFSFDYWSESAANDNHYKCALKSITFSSNGEIIGCKMLISNDTTANVTPAGTSIISSDFVLPQGFALQYPESRLRQALKITGSFVTAYDNTDNMYTILDNHFTAVTQSESTPKGKISILCKSEEYTASSELDLSGWAPNSYHMFEGGAI